MHHAYRPSAESRSAACTGICCLCLQAATQLVCVLVPLLTVLTHEQVRLDPTLANPVLSTLHGVLSLVALSAAVADLSAAAAGDELYIKRLLQQQGGMVSVQALSLAAAMMWVTHHTCHLAKKWRL
jgi:hypothetical protein